ncbi:MAG TPA: ABC transporter permease [Spirochaetales bacterium]|nr:ABC transporter permease [Spirochaetales bacterium]
MNNKKKKDQAVNEFNQVMKPISLWADAWKRLRKNKMAFVSLIIVGLYTIISLGAPLLTQAGIIYDYKEQNINNATLPPSFRPAGDLVIAKMESRISQLEEAVKEKEQTQQDSGYSASSGFDFGTVPETEGGEVSPQENGEAAQDAEIGTTTTDSDYIDPNVTFSLDFGGHGIDTASADPLVRELNFQKENLEKIKSEMDTDPSYKKVYIFGTDDLGRDLLSRTIYGGRISIMIGLVGTLTAALVGILFGAIAGYMGGWLDNVMMRFVDIMYGLPYMLIVIIIMAFVGEKARGNFAILFVAIALVSWLTIARVVRGQIISLKNSEFVEAARSMGASTWRIITKHLLPNTLGIIIVYSTMLMPSFIMNESFLSFLGLGVSAPEASWGTLVSEGVKAMEFSSWQLLAPSIAMTLFLFCMNFLGDGLRDALDPQSKNRT